MSERNIHTAKKGAGALSHGNGGAIRLPVAHLICAFSLVVSSTIMANRVNMIFGELFVVVLPCVLAGR